MAVAPDLSILSGSSMTSNIGSVLMIGVIIMVVFSGIIGFIVWNLRKKRWTKTITLYKGMGTGEKPFLFATYKAREIKIGKAGDKLWIVRGAGKYINVGTETIAKEIYPYYEATDGEWHNFSFDSFDAVLDKMGIRMIPQDMRLNRLAIESAIEKELAKKKSLWDMIKDFIPTLIFYLVVVVCVVIIFYQFGKISDMLGKSAEMLASSLGELMKYEQRICNYNQSIKGLIPAFMLIITPKFLRRKKK